MTTRVCLGHLQPPDDHRRRLVLPGSCLTATSAPALALGDHETSSNLQRQPNASRLCLTPLWRRIPFHLGRMTSSSRRSTSMSVNFSRTVAAARARGSGTGPGEVCEGVGPERRAGVSPGRSPRPALRTGRGTLTASGSAHRAKAVSVVRQVNGYLSARWHAALGSASDTRPRPANGCCDDGTFTPRGPCLP